MLFRKLIKNLKNYIKKWLSNLCWFVRISEIIIYLNLLRKCKI